MTALRSLFRNHLRLAALLVALALAMKALVPGGYMAGSQAKVFTVEICADATGQKVWKQIVIPRDVQPAGGRSERGKADATCPFTALAEASLSGADAALLAIALAIILALGFAPVLSSYPKRPSYLRPPLRGPPALA